MPLQELKYPVLGAEHVQVSWNLMAALQTVVLQQENGKSETERRTASVRISR